MKPDEPYDVYTESKYISYQTPLDVVFYKRTVGSDQDIEVMVPYWLVEEINTYFHSESQRGMQWDYANQVAFDVIISCVPYIRTKEDFQVLLDTISCDEVQDWRCEMYEAVDNYANKVREKFQEKRLTPRRDTCLVCRTMQSIPALEVCSNCRIAYRDEEQRLRLHLYRARKAGMPATL